MLNGFKQFILRGNVIDLAVGVVIGAAFGSVVNSLVKDIITPLISALIRVPDFAGLYAVLGTSRIAYGSFLNILLTFLLTAAAVYFLVVMPINALVRRLHRGDEPPPPDTRKCPECLSEIPIAARKCKFCASAVEAAR
jgi:large conductance mechanosensitive channel